MFLLQLYVCDNILTLVAAEGNRELGMALDYLLLIAFFSFMPDRHYIEVVLYYPEIFVRKL